MAVAKFNPLVLDAIAEEQSDLGTPPNLSFEEWSTQFSSVLGLYSSSASAIGAAARHAANLERGGEPDADTKQTVEALRAQAQAEGLNARLFILRIMAMGFHWLEAHEAEGVRQS